MHRIWIGSTRCLLAALALALGGASALRSQPLIEYRFDDRVAIAAGTVANARSGSYGGTLSGARSQVRGALGNGVDFDGTSGFMSAAGTTGLNFGTGITVEAFVRRDTNAGEDSIVSKWYYGDQFLLTFYPTGNGQLFFSVRSPAGTYGNIAYNIPDNTYLGEWVHVAGTYDGAGNFRLYWNGTQVASSLVSVSGMASGSVPIRVGDANNPWSRFDGAIDEVKIWNRALAASEFSRPLRPRVLVVEYDSTNPIYNNPHTISTNLITDVGNSSKYVRHEIIQWIDTGALPPQRSGGGFNYAGLFANYDVCGRARRGEIHEVWVWGGPDTGMLEWAVTGPYREAYGLGVGMPACDTQMVTMGFNRRQDRERVERLLSQIKYPHLLQPRARPHYYFMKGILTFSHDRLEEAEPHLSRALSLGRLSPGSVCMTHCMLATIQASRGKASQARQHLESAHALPHPAELDALIASTEERIAGGDAGLPSGS